MLENSWLRLADEISTLAGMLGRGWQETLPPFDCLPSKVLDDVVDEWCERLVSNQPEAMHPPVEARPWILARLHIAHASAKGIAGVTDIAAPVLSSDVLRKLLIDAWHQRLRDVWPLNMDLDEA